MESILLMMSFNSLMVHLMTKVGEYGIIVDEDKKQFLLVQWGKYYNYTWHFPGGRI